MISTGPMFWPLFRSLRFPLGIISANTESNVSVFLVGATVAVAGVMLEGENESERPGKGLHLISIEVTSAVWETYGLASSLAQSH